MKIYTVTGERKRTGETEVFQVKSLEELVQLVNGKGLLPNWLIEERTL